MVNSIETNPTRYVPMMAEWLAVPPWQRWAIWMRAGEVGVKAFEIAPMPLDRFDGIHVSSINLPEFTTTLAKKIGHRRAPTFNLIPFGGIGLYGIYDPLKDTLYFYLFCHDHMSSASGNAVEDTDYAEYYRELGKRRTIV
ncbi:MAG: hypothetical protein Q7S68_00050, partial [Deltaproteobacteria bacterium]|nr:hypothetical protein [Deltaproteobacteria bacterium]